MSAATNEPLEMNSWTAVKFIGNNLTLKINFTNPLEVSYNQDELGIKDMVTMKVKDKKLFMALVADEMHYLSDSSISTSNVVEKQLTDDAATNLLVSNIDNIKGGMNTVIII
jgi:hypothetical protein